MQTKRGTCGDLFQRVRVNTLCGARAIHPRLAMEAQSSVLVTGELAANGTVLVRGSEVECRSLHSWVGGSFGELLAVDELSDPAQPAIVVDRLEAREMKTRMMLRLRAVEAYYLVCGLPEPRLRVIWSPTVMPAPAISADATGSEDGSVALSASELWDALEAGEPLLPYLYCAYKTLREAGWRIRDGVKFGFDFALYDGRYGPSKHAPLGALVLVPQEEAERSWLWVQRHARVCHSVGKALLLCSVEPTGEGGALELRTVRIDGWDPGRAHATISDNRKMK